MPDLISVNAARNAIGCVKMDPTNKIYLVPATFLVAAQDQTDATKRIRRALKLLAPYPSIGVMKAELGEPKQEQP